MPQVDASFLALPRHELAEAALQRAKDLGATFAEFRLERIRSESIALRYSQLESAKEADSRRTLEDKIIEALLARHEFGIPDAMVMRQVGHHIEHTRDRLRRQGVDPDRIQLDYGKLLTELRPAAEVDLERLVGRCAGGSEVDEDHVVLAMDRHQRRRVVGRKRLREREAAGAATLIPTLVTPDGSMLAMQPKG